jgi:hypothetical protein
LGYAYLQASLLCTNTAMQQTWICLIYGVLRPCSSLLPFGIWHLALGIWHLAFGIWPLAFSMDGEPTPPVTTPTQPLIIDQLPHSSVNSQRANQLSPTRPTWRRIWRDPTATRPLSRSAGAAGAGAGAVGAGSPQEISFKVVWSTSVWIRYVIAALSIAFVLVP